MNRLVLFNKNKTKVKCSYRGNIINSEEVFTIPYKKQKYKDQIFYYGAYPDAFTALCDVVSLYMKELESVDGIDSNDWSKEKRCKINFYSKLSGYVNKSIGVKRSDFENDIDIFKKMKPTDDYLLNPLLSKYKTPPETLKKVSDLYDLVNKLLVEKLEIKKQKRREKTKKRKLTTDVPEPSKELVPQTHFYQLCTFSLDESESENFTIARLPYYELYQDGTTSPKWFNFTDIKVHFTRRCVYYKYDDEDRHERTIIFDVILTEPSNKLLSNKIAKLLLDKVDSTDSKKTPFNAYFQFDSKEDLLDCCPDQLKEKFITYFIKNSII